VHGTTVPWKFLRQATVRPRPEFSTPYPDIGSRPAGRPRWRARRLGTPAECDDSVQRPRVRPPADAWSGWRGRGRDLQKPSLVDVFPDPGPWRGRLRRRVRGERSPEAPAPAPPPARPGAGRRTSPPSSAAD